MNIPMEFILVTSSLGAAQSGFFGAYFLSTLKRRDFSRLFLGLLFIALSIRMGKSVGYYFSNDNLPSFVENIGYAAHIAIAPLLFLYAKSFVEKSFIFKKGYWFLLIPSGLALVFSPFLDDSFWLGTPKGYFLSLYYFGLHFPFIYYLLFKTIRGRKKRISKQEIVWLFMVVIGINFVWAAYAANYLLGLVPYITAPLAFSFVIYPISFFILTQYKMFLPDESEDEKYKNSSLTKKQIEDFAGEIETFVVSENGYRDTNLTLSKLARHMTVSSQAVSEVVNRYFEMSFTEYVNTHRLEEACLMLKDERNYDKKIASVAYECGFGTLSAFNTLFKKQTKMTPTEYKKNFVNPK